MVRWFIRRTFGHKVPAHLLEELEQAALYDACRAARRFDPTKAKFSTYVTNAAHGAAKRWLRDCGHMVRPKRDEPGFGIVFFSQFKTQDDDGDVDFSDCIEELAVEDEPSDFRLTVETKLKRLPERDQEIFRLRFYDGLSQDEIGRRVGISQMHVSRILVKITDQLRRWVSEN